MKFAWTKSPTGRRVLEHWADPRPAWLWSADGQTLLWRNLAARLFPGKGRKRQAAAADAVPIRGQVARLIRLGALGRTSLSRMQFVAGERPVSATCACTPLSLDDDETALLVVNVDPISPDMLAPPLEHDAVLEGLFPPGADYLLIDDDGQFAGGSARAMARYAPALESEGLPPLDGEGAGTLAVESEAIGFLRFKASPQDASLLLFEAPSQVTPEAPEAAPLPTEPLLPLGLPPVPAPAAVAPPQPDSPDGMSTGGGLTSLFDRLLGDGALFTPLDVEEEADAVDQPTAVGALPTSGDDSDISPVEDEPESEEAVAVEATTPPESDKTETDDETPAPVLYRIVGRLFTPLAEPAPVDASAMADAPVESDSAVAEIASPDMEDVAAAIDVDAPGDDVEPLELLAPDTPTIETASIAEPDAPAPDAAPDAESVERVSRYNFDELSRILNDRVGNGEPAPADETAAVPDGPRRPLPRVPSATPTGALVTLGGETLVLNRLPLGILVFREQQLLFANRAITEMTGYDSVENLRTAGLAAIFPAAGDEAQEAGPVNHLVRRDGALLPVTARLQSVSWQGKPALMLSASATEVRTGHEAAVRAFAEMFATTRAEGFIEMARSGALTEISAEARAILNRGADPLIGRPISAFIAPDQLPALREFFERPARFAETARPAITVKGAEPGVEILIFSQGQAGIVSNYFGLVRRSGGRLLPALAGPVADADPALLARLSRGVRRPLNTVIGFSDLISSAAFGPLDHERYREYARDIKTAGLEIAALVDELDDFARLRDGRYTARPTDIDLVGLLESSVARVRGEAKAARVLVRSAISETLPRVRADRASLAQAILNLLASAIDQTPQDGSVVLSAQVDDAGGITINVRDSAQNLSDLGERFVVFRDGVGRDGQAQAPVRSSVGLALTRALLAVNQATLSVDPAVGAGTIFSLVIPPENVVQMRELPAKPTA